MADQAFDQDAWERRWAQVLRDHQDKVASRPPNPLLLREVGGLSPGRALDAGCGHGAEAIWLAAAGWHVIAVDFSASALEHGRTTVEALGDGLAGDIEWIEADLGAWTPPAAQFDLVSSLYVHVAGSVGAMVTRLGSGVAPGGTLLLAGHRPIVPETGEPSPAAGQQQVCVEDALAVLDADAWDIVVAEERPRAVAGSGVDAVVRAVRRPA